MERKTVRGVQLRGTKTTALIGVILAKNTSVVIVGLLRFVTCVRLPNAKIARK